MSESMKSSVSTEIYCESESSCRLDALISIDERGQIILPKDIRDKAKMKAGDKLAVVICEKRGRICCISLIKAEEFKEGIKKALGPLLEELR